MVALSPLPPPGWGGEWKEKGKKLVGQDKGSLTEQQTEQTVTTKNWEGEYTKQTVKCTEQLSPPGALHAPKPPLTSPSPFPHQNPA